MTICGTIYNKKLRFVFSKHPHKHLNQLSKI